MNVIPGVCRDESPSGGDGDVDGHAPVVALGHPRRGDSEAEEAGVGPSEFARHAGVVREIGNDQLPEFVVLLSRAASTDRHHALDARIEE
jgi:hypothetical protein